MATTCKSLKLTSKCRTLGMHGRNPVWESSTFTWRKTRYLTSTITPREKQHAKELIFTTHRKCPIRLHWLLALVDPRSCMPRSPTSPTSGAFQLWINCLGQTPVSSTSLRMAISHPTVLIFFGCSLGYSKGFGPTPFSTARVTGHPRRLSQAAQVKPRGVFVGQLLHQKAELEIELLNSGPGPWGGRVQTTGSTSRNPPNTIPWNLSN